MNPRSILLGVLIALYLAIYACNHAFGTFGNINNVLRQTSPMLIAAIGMTFVIATGGIDLSVGSMVAVSGIVTGILLRYHIEWFMVILSVVTFGAAIGLIKKRSKRSKEIYNEGTAFFLRSTGRSQWG